MKLKHTPGPWVYQGGDDASCEVNIGESTASIPRHDKNTGEYVFSRQKMEANARLIAAAPEMLDALINIMKTAFICATVSPCEKGETGKHCEDVQKIIDAIESATGLKIEEVLAE